jgi:hypothetical protein
MNTTQKPILAALSGTVVLVVALMAPWRATAAELGFYVGGQYGTASKDEDASTLDALTLGFYDDLEYAPSVRTNRFESEETTWGFFGGYRLLQNLAFEAGYMSIGKEVLRESSSGTFFGGETPEPESWITSFGVRSTGFALSALGVLPITYNWEIFARGGVYLASNTLSLYAINQEGFGGADQVTESSADFLVGAGAGYTLAEVYQLRAEYQRILDAGSSEFGEADVDLLTIGITVRF